MTIDSIHAIAALCVGIVLIALSWLLPRDSGNMYDARNASSTVRHATPSAPRVLRPIPQHPARRNMHTSSPRAHGACIFSFCLQSANSSSAWRNAHYLVSIIKNIVDNAGLPTAYGIDQNIKIAFVLLLVPTVACWYAFLGSGLRGEQSYSPTRPMVFRRGTPSIFKELLSGFSFAIAQPALLWFASVPCWPSMAHRHSCWKMACLCLHMASGLSAALLYSRSPAAWHLVRSAHFNVCHVEVMPSTR